MIRHEAARPGAHGSRARPLHVAIMGIRGVPAAHGGFESFAERLAPFLASQGFTVTVYCQEDGLGPITRSHWGEVHRVHIPSGQDTPVASMRFDWRCISHAASQRPDVALVLGYNTAIFTARLRAAGIPTVINMDGIEYSRRKWSPAARAWLFLNERMGCWLGHHLVADHPVIATHLATRVSRRKITTIPYGGDVLEEADSTPLSALGLRSREFVTVIARPEPENSILEIVQAFSAKRRRIRMVVLGNFQPAECAFHAEVMAAASQEVLFPGAIYDARVVRALRTHCLFYVHGHQVGGTNPSLLEAMGAGNAVLAHDNPFNRWVVGAGARYFEGRAGCETALNEMLSSGTQLDRMRQMNRQRVASVFDWKNVLQAYASLLRAAGRHQFASQTTQKHAHWERHPT
jgi:glycosyltransferase involved in cell wall biosynthesis